MGSRSKGIAAAATGLGILGLALGTKTGRSTLTSIGEGIEEANRLEARARQREVEGRAKLDREIAEAKYQLASVGNRYSDSYDYFKKQELKEKIRRLERLRNDPDFM